MKKKQLLFFIFVSAIAFALISSLLLNARLNGAALVYTDGWTSTRSHMGLQCGVSTNLPQNNFVGIPFTHHIYEGCNKASNNSKAYISNITFYIVASLIAGLIVTKLFRNKFI